MKTPEELTAESLGEGLGRALMVATIAIVILKANGLVDWSWAWAFLPFGAPVALMVVSLVAKDFIKEIKRAS